MAINLPRDENGLVTADAQHRVSWRLVSTWYMPIGARRVAQSRGRSIRAPIDAGDALTALDLMGPPGGLRVAG